MVGDWIAQSKCGFPKSETLFHFWISLRLENQKQFGWIEFNKRVILCKQSAEIPPVFPGGTSSVDNRKPNTKWNGCLLMENWILQKLQNNNKS